MTSFRVRNFDFFLLLIHLVIFSLGAFAILSTSFSAFQSQLIFFAVGLLLYFLASTFDYAIIKKPFPILIIYVLSIIVLGGLFVFGENIRNSVRWYNFKTFNFQPSEVVKIAAILILARFLSPISQKYLSTKRAILSLFLVSPFILLIARQPDLGSALVILGIWAFMVLYAGVNPKHILIFLLAVSLLSYPTWSVLHDYQRQRVISFIDPYADPLGSGYNVIQSIVAVGSGEVFGRGFGRGTQSHLRFLPEYRTDFIFAAFSEEWGFLGSVILVFFYSGLLYKILAISNRAKDSYSALLSLGVFSLLFIQSLVNIGMNLGVLPVTGITLPLVSYGGSSLIATSVLLGLVQGVAIKSRLW